MPAPISLARPTCDLGNVAPRMLRDAQRGGAMAVQAHPKQAPAPTPVRPVLRPVESKRRPATLHLFTYIVGNALAWILWGAITISTDTWYWWPLVPLAAWTLVLSLHLWHVYRADVDAGGHRTRRSSPKEEAMTELVVAERNKPGAIETEEARSPSSADSSRRVLVVVDEPCTSPEPCASIRTDAGSGPTDALVIAPTHGAAATRWYVDEDASRADAAQRLRTCVACLADDGIRAEGRLGDPDPVQAITDALQVYVADEIQLITAPQRPSGWLHQNVIDRARRSFEQPIKHVVMPTQGETQARPRHIRPNHGPPPASAASPRHAARHSSLWKRFVAGAGRGLQLLWRYRLGWLAGHSLLVLTHRGRRTGRQHRSVLYVQRYDRQTHEATVVSVWGESQWLRNIRAHPAMGVEIGLQRYVPEQQFLSTDEIFEIEKRFRRRHRIVAWGQAKLMGWPWPATDEQLLALSAQLRGVAFRPASATTNDRSAVEGR